MAVPVIRQLKKWAISQPGQAVIRDAPPGTSCPVVETIRGSDCVVRVTEPTPFGLHDLELAVQVTGELGIPTGVVINRVNGPYLPLEEFCSKKNLTVLLRIPYEREIAEGVAQGKTLVEIHPEYVEPFVGMFTRIAQRI
jgi:MinD superfamily P-loop ATPase